MTLLFLHPSGHVNDAVLPVGALAAINSVACERRGRYAIELRDEDIRWAKVVALDLHWALALPSALAISEHVRRVSPDARIVIGGISAGLWAKELVERRVADFVVRGDAEPGFPALVEALVGGREPGPLPNVWGPDGREPEQARASPEQLSRTSGVLAPWFPGYERLQALGASALSHDRVSVLVRGCAMRCPGCYGSFASSFGPGTLSRTPESLSQEARLAAGAGSRHWVVVAGKANAGLLRDSALSLARSGPHAISEHLGLFCCQPPEPATLDALVEALPCRVGVSALDPLDHVPVPTEQHAERELEAWRALADRVRASTRLELVLWTSELERVPLLSRELGADGRAVRVAWAGAWEVTRPRSDQSEPSFEVVLAAVEPFWTFAAARASSPSLGRILAPFDWLDELYREPTPPAGLDPALAHASDEAFEGWRRDRLPSFPSLGFCVTPLSLPFTSADEALPRREPPFVSGDLALSRPGALAALGLGRATPVEPKRDARGMSFRARVESTAGALALYPRPRALAPDDRGWLAALDRDGVLVLRLPETPSGVVEVEARFAFDALTVTCVDSSGRRLAKGRATAGLYSRGHPLDLVG